jgi:hypothetical protein
MASGQVDLLQVFQAAAEALQQNQSTLNQADSYNHDHGDNMVSTFNTIVQALQQKQDAKPAAQLKYVSQQLQQTATSGSGKMYADGFAQAANQFKNSGITLENILQLILMILGGGQKSTTSGSTTDIIGSILGGLLGGQGSNSSQSNQGIDLGSLLGTILGGQSSSSQSSQGNVYGGQSGQSSGSAGDLLGTLIGGIVGNSGMSDTASHTQSGEIVTSSILGALAKILGQ